MYLLLLACFFLLILLPVRGVQHWRGFDMASTQYLKLALTLAILWHHLPPIEIPFLAQLGGIVGRYGVGIFFFLSGFGLMKGLIAQGKDKYFDGFFRKRFSKILIPFLLVFLCYALFRAGALSIDTFIRHWQIGENFVSYSYFVEELCTLYVLFYATFRFAALKLGLAISWGVALVLMYSYASLGYHEHWWISTLGFPVGLTLASVTVWTPQRFVMLVSTLIVIAGLYVFARSLAADEPQIRVLLFAFLMTPLSTGLCYLILPLIKVKLAGPSSWIVTASYEIYLLQGLLISLIVNQYGNHGMSMWGIFLVIIPISYAIHVLGNRLNRLI